MLPCGDLYLRLMIDTMHPQGATGANLTTNKNSFLIVLSVHFYLLLIPFLKKRFPDCVKLDRDDVKHWFTESARRANKALGDKMMKKSLSKDCLILREIYFGDITVLSVFGGRKSRRFFKYRRKMTV